MGCNCCDKQEPSIVIQHKDASIVQYPQPIEFRSVASWPADLAKLYDEAAKAYSAGAYTAASMVCRKLLMSCACHEKADEGKSFAEYVEYITEKVLTFPRAKGAIDRIRTIGNEANHEIQFVDQMGAQRALQIVTYMLNTIYSLPSA